MALLLLIAFGLHLVEDPGAAGWLFAGYVVLKLFLARRARYF